ncbi:MAG: OB-fold domain-containing protein [Myxococcota bacterium]|nr:OB-fold domain-containing protein [Myxococcota bacterium]
MSEHSVPKPLPVLEGFAKEFYEGCQRGELLFQCCETCGTWRHVPRELCADCGSWEWAWKASSGRGKVFTWTVIARPLHPAFAEDVPLAAVVVELEEGVRLLSHVVDCPPEELEMEMPVEVSFDPITEDVTLPRFRRANS